MKTVRVIPRLDIKGPNLVKGVHLEGLRVMGKPQDFARYYYKSGADELMFMDVVASLYGRNCLQDIISRTASEIFSVEESLITPEMRRLAKNINFGIIYGISGYGLAKQLGTSPSLASGYIKQYFERYKRVKQYIDRSITDAQNKGYAETIIGRRRYIPELNSKDRSTRGFGERTAMNTPIQGSAADIINMAMIKIHNELKTGYKTKMILQVHDELLFEVYKNELDPVTDMIKNFMENAWKLNVPINVDIGLGSNWSQAH